MDNVKDKLNESLSELEQLFIGFPLWLKGQYDHASGGFYYAQSSKGNPKFSPDIESTAQAVNILERFGMLTDLPEHMRLAIIRFMQNKQDPQTGYFYDENPNMRNDQILVARAIGYSRGTLRKLGAEPLYPLPVQANARPTYIENPKKYAEWLRSIDLRNSWRGCDLLSGSSIYIAQMDEEERKPYVQEAINYFASIQDPNTGLWGEGTPYVQISGTFKLYNFYSRMRVPMPRVNEMYRSFLSCLRNEEAVDMCYIRNPINLLEYIEIEIPDHELVEIIQISIANMRKLKRDDGGFSREIDHSPTAPNVAQVKEGDYYPNMPDPVHVGEGKVEGDMNAGTQAVLIRSLCYKFVEQEAPPIAPIDWNEQ